MLGRSLAVHTGTLAHQGESAITASRLDDKRSAGCWAPESSGKAEPSSGTESDKCSYRQRQSGPSKSKTGPKSQEEIAPNAKA